MINTSEAHSQMRILLLCLALPSLPCPHVLHLILHLEYKIHDLPDVLLLAGHSLRSPQRAMAKRDRCSLPFPLLSHTSVIVRCSTSRPCLHFVVPYLVARLPCFLSQAMGFHLVVYPLAGLYAATYALKNVYDNLKEKGTTRDMLPHLTQFRCFTQSL